MTPKPSCYIALFRAINVGGHAVIKMSELKKMFEQMGFFDAAHIFKPGMLYSSQMNLT